MIKRGPVVVAFVALELFGCTHVSRQTVPVTSAALLSTVEIA
jgi:hypothetical protein